jgi:ornithine carbamoyltransferase
MNAPSNPRHFLTLMDLSPEELRRIVHRATELKQLHYARKPHTPLSGRVLGMIFEKSSTRTRVSFEAGMAQMGGAAMFLSPRDTQLGRGEPIEDTARVLSRMVDGIMIRTFDHATVETFAAYSRVPVINGLTDLCHPCQLLADMQTYVEHRGDIRGKRVTWVGDVNNMCHSYIGAARQFDFQLRIACPEGFDPEPDMLRIGDGRCEIVRDPHEAVRGSDLVVTDTWISMGQEEEKARRERAFAGYRVDREMMALAADDALFLHCLPAYRGKEVTADVLDAPDSVVWDEAENRMHAQKALLEFLLAA